MNAFFVSSLAVVLLAGLMWANTAAAAESAPNADAAQKIIRNGENASVKGPAQIMTGNVRIDRYYDAQGDMRSTGALVTFEPGARSHWHTHPVGQVLIVTSGVGRTQQWGKPIQEIRPGDVVICPANVKHWHGAGPDTAMSHISICEEKEPGKVVQWLEEVTDDQYNGK